MRRLIVTRGAPGSGKSTALAAAGLADYTLSADTLRLVLGGPVLATSGRLEIDQGQNARVWSWLMRLLEERMSRGELVCVDATHPTASTFTSYTSLANRYRYEACCLDFSSVPAEDVLQQNQRRAPLRVVPEAVVRRAIAECTRDPGPGPGYHRISWAADGAHLRALEAWLTEPAIEVDAPIWVGAPVHARDDVTAGVALVLADGSSVPPSAVLVVAAGVHAALAALEAVVLKAGPTRVLVTPGAMSAWPERLALVPSAQLAAGLGDDAPATFDRVAPPGAWNLHGGARSVGRSISVHHASLVLGPDGTVEVVTHTSVE